MFEVAGHPVCVDCNLKIQQAFQMKDAALKEQLNYLADQADALTGIYGITPRYEIQRPVIHSGPVNFHSINIDRSVVGAINTGSVKKMEVALNNIHNQKRDPALESMLKGFTEDVLKEEKLSVEKKDEILEQLAALTDQLIKPKESQVIVIGKALVNNIAANLAATALIANWQQIKTAIGF